MQEPLSLQILRTIEKFSLKGPVPVSFLYQQIPASPNEIETRVRSLAEDGAVKLEGDLVSLVH